jgi:hypothetical protein
VTAVAAQRRRRRASPRASSSQQLRVNASASHAMPSRPLRRPPGRAAPPAGGRSACVSGAGGVSASSAGPRALFDCCSSAVAYTAYRRQYPELGAACAFRPRGTFHSSSEIAIGSHTLTSRLVHFKKPGAQTACTGHGRGRTTQLLITAAAGRLLDRARGRCEQGGIRAMCVYVRTFVHPALSLAHRCSPP